MPWPQVPIERLLLPQGASVHLRQPPEAQIEVAVLASAEARQELFAVRADVRDQGDGVFRRRFADQGACGRSPDAQMIFLGAEQGPATVEDFQRAEGGL